MTICLARKPSYLSSHIQLFLTKVSGISNKTNAISKPIFRKNFQEVISKIDKSKSIIPISDVNKHEKSSKIIYQEMSLSFSIHVIGPFSASTHIKKINVLITEKNFPEAMKLYINLYSRLHQMSIWPKDFVKISFKLATEFLAVNGFFENKNTNNSPGSFINCGVMLMPKLIMDAITENHMNIYNNSKDMNPYNEFFPESFYPIVNYPRIIYPKNLEKSLFLDLVEKNKKARLNHEKYIKYVENILKLLVQQGYFEAKECLDILQNVCQRDKNKINTTYLNLGFQTDAIDSTLLKNSLIRIHP